MGYSFRLAAMVLLYASSNREDNIYHRLCYTSRGTLTGNNNNNVFVWVFVCVWGGWVWGFCLPFFLVKYNHIAKTRNNIHVLCLENEIWWKRFGLTLVLF